MVRCCCSDSCSISSILVVVVVVDCYVKMQGNCLPLLGALTTSYSVLVVFVVVLDTCSSNSCCCCNIERCKVHCCCNVDDVVGCIYACTPAIYVVLS